MSEQPKKKSRAAFWTAAIVISLIIAYPLSVGPVQWLTNHGMVSQPVADFFIAFYLPLRKISQKFEWVNRVLRWYVGLWW
jgi:hypothetical protein